MSHRYHDILQKTGRLSETVSTIGLKVNKKKSQVMSKNTNRNTPVYLDGTPLEDIQEFVTTDGDCDQDVSTRISKANQAFAMPRPI
jgi:hypothetical protein